MSKIARCDLCGISSVCPVPRIRPEVPAQIVVYDCQNYRIPKKVTLQDRIDKLRELRESEKQEKQEPCYVCKTLTADHCVVCGQPVCDLHITFVPGQGSICDSCYENT